MYVVFSGGSVTFTASVSLALSSAAACAVPQLPSVLARGALNGDATEVTGKKKSLAVSNVAFGAGMGAHQALSVVAPKGCATAPTLGAVSKLTAAAWVRPSTDGQTNGVGVVIAQEGVFEVAVAASTLNVQVRLANCYSNA